MLADNRDAPDLETLVALLSVPILRFGNGRGIDRLLKLRTMGDASALPCWIVSSHKQSPCKQHFLCGSGTSGLLHWNTASILYRPNTYSARITPRVRVSATAFFSGKWIRAKRNAFIEQYHLKVFLDDLEVKLKVTPT